jgi:hypothetical protein
MGIIQKEMWGGLMFGLSATLVASVDPKLSGTVRQCVAAKLRLPISLNKKNVAESGADSRAYSRIESPIVRTSVTGCISIW